jgi:hypothetical protein
MTVEQIVYSALGGLAGGSVYPDVAPAHTPAPWVVYQAVGGQGSAYVDGTAQATRNSRVQVTVWSDTRLSAADLMEACYQALVNPTVKAVPIGSPVSIYESDTLLYGSRLDFSITY